MAPPETAEPDGDEGPAEKPTTFVGGRHGSPTVNVSLPFSKLSFGDDPRTAETVETLTGLVSRLSTQVARLAEKAGVDDVRAEAEGIAEQLAAVLDDLAGDD